MPIFCHLPKRVRLVNSKLSLLYWILWVLVLAVLVLNFVIGRDYNVRVDVSDYMFAMISLSHPGADALRAGVANAMKTSDFCTVPRKYDYWLDPNGFWAFENFTCRAVCPDDYIDHACIPIPDLGETTLSGDTFIVTSVMDEVTHAGEPQLLHWRSANYWVMSAENFTLNIHYAFEFHPHRGFLDRYKSYLGISGEQNVRRSSNSGSASERLTTVMLDSESRFWRIVPPGFSVTITLKDLMHMLVQPTLLDDPNVDLPTPNQLKRDGVVDKPPVRLTGLAITLELGCYTSKNPNLERTDLPDFVKALKSEELCTLKPRRVGGGFVRVNRLDDLGNGTLLYRKYYGVKVFITKMGMDEYLDFKALLLNGIACIVLLGYPSKIITFVATRCLGHLSRVYKRVLVQEFDINMHLAGTATRLSATLPILESMSDATGGVENVFRAHYQSLRALLHGREVLDDDEVAALARFSLDELRQIEMIKNDSFTSRARRSLGLKTRMSHIVAPESVGAQQLSSACWVDDPVNMHDLACFFDRGRKVSMLERLFTPRELWMAVHKAHSRQQDVEDFAGTFSSRDVSDKGGLGAVQQSSPSSTQPQADLPSSDFSSQSVAKLEERLAQLESRPAEERLAQLELRLAESERCMMEWKEAVSCTMSSFEARLRALELPRTDNLAVGPGISEECQQEHNKKAQSPEDALGEGFAVQVSLFGLEHRVASLEQHLSLGIFEGLSLTGPQRLDEGRASSTTMQGALSEGSEALRDSFPKTGQVSGRPDRSTPRTMSVNNCPKHDIEQDGDDQGVQAGPEPNAPSSWRFLGSIGNGVEGQVNEDADLRLEPQNANSRSSRSVPREGA